MLNVTRDNLVLSLFSSVVSRFFLSQTRIWAGPHHSDDLPPAQKHTNTADKWLIQQAILKFKLLHEAFFFF